MKLMKKLTRITQQLATKVYREETKLLPTNYHQEWIICTEKYWFGNYASTAYRNSLYFADYHVAAQAYLQKQKTAEYFHFYPGWEDIRQGEVNHLLGLV